MDLIYKTLMLFVLVVWAYVYFARHATAKRTATIETMSSISLTCETDVDCTSLVAETDFCGRAKKTVKVSKKNPRYDAMVLLSSKNTTPGALDKIARGFFRDCLSASDAVKVKCVEGSCK